MMQPIRLVALLATVVLLAGCGVLGGGVYNAPLPGGADVGSDPITVTADFDDALDLVPQSSVKVDDVAVGRVRRITLSKDGRSAEVELVVRRGVALPEGTVARIQQTSLLGEKYVALVRPPHAAGATTTALLAGGAHLGKDHTDAAAEVEEVLGALSLVLNGGGIGQFQEISRELQQVGHGRTAEMRQFLEQTQRFVSVLDRRSSAITTALDGLARLGRTLDGDRARIAHTLEGLAPGMKVLAEQRPQLVRMLRSLDRLSRVTLTTLHASQDDMVADFKLLAPILQQLAKAGSDLPYALEILLTYPFPDAVLGAIKGDYLNVFMTTNFRTLPAGCAEMGCTWPQVGRGSAARRGSPLPPLGTAPVQPPTLLPPTDAPSPPPSSPQTPSTPGGM
ncbi:MCE family protein [Nocardioides ginsengisoli]|uniref:MCE family protein n=1 Tax=Nocardioides ginsengisoli TaxID=363868 RepID=A0ABW3W295_9ACTN